MVWAIGDPQRHGCYTCPIVPEAAHGRGGRFAAGPGRGGRGGRTVNLYQAGVNSMMRQVDPFADEESPPDTFQHDIEAWTASREFENTHSSF